ncbi:MAG: ABC transporter permease, partial [Vicinamibacterales bacterium]
MIGEAAAQAARALAARPLRTGLGALAIAVAVATIVVVVTALDGVAAYARATTARAFGSDTFLIAQVASPGRVTRRELQDQLRRNPPITRRELRALEAYADGRVIYAPNAQTTAEVSSGGRTYENGAVTGTTASLADIRDLAIDRGRFFRVDEDARGAQVAVIGVDVAEALFPGRDPLGQALRVAGRRFEVIGTQERLGSSGGASLDRYVWVPLKAYERAFGAPRSLQVFARAADGLPSVAGEDRARISLRAVRSLRPGAPDTFDLLTPDAARDFVLSISTRIGAAAGPISLMALLAAIVVITNTVLVSVTERTREIGVRRALGAARRQIMREVFAESVLVSVLGGTVGALAAIGVLTALGRALSIPLDVRATTVAWSLAASAASGLAAGWYPARRATRVDV